MAVVPTTSTSSREAKLSKIRSFMKEANTRAQERGYEGAPSTVRLGGYDQQLQYDGNRAYAWNPGVGGQAATKKYFPQYDRPAGEGSSSGSAFSDYIQRLMYERKQANEQTKQDRQTALGDLQALEREIGTNYTQLINQARADEQALNQQTLFNFQQSVASLGRTISPGAMLNLSRKLAATSTSRLNTQQATLKDEYWQRQFDIARARDDIFRNTNRQTISDSELLSIAAKYGSASGSARRIIR